MNKKLIVFLAVAAVLVLAVIAILIWPVTEAPAQADTPEQTQEGSSVEDKTEPAGKDDESTGFWESLFSGKLFGNRKEETDPSDTSVTTDPAETEPQQDPTDPLQETGVQPDSGETLPPDVDVSMGVVAGEGSSDIDEDLESTAPSKPAGTTNPTQPSKPAETTDPTEPSEPADNTDPTGPSSSTGSTNPLDENYDITTLTFEAYLGMTGEQQKAVIDAFASPEVFVSWYKAAEAKYMAEHPDIEIGSDGSINGGDLG